MAGRRASRIQAQGREWMLTDATFDAIEKLESFAAEHGAGLLDVAIGGLAAKPQVASVIAGATSREQVAQNVAAGNWRPAGSELTMLDEITSR